MTSLTRLAARALYGRRYRHVPKGQRVYLRPGDRHVRRLQRFLRHRSSVVSLEDYRKSVPLGEIEEFLACALCGETRQQPVYRPRGEYRKRGKPSEPGNPGEPGEPGEPGKQSKRGKTWEYRVVRCPSCGFLYRNPNIRPEHLGDLYSGGGYSKFLTGDYGRNRQRRYRLTMDALSPIFDEGAGRRLLDFGCGTGLFLELAERRDFECYGVDLAPDSVEQAQRRLRAAKVFLGSPDAVPQIAAGNFDVITMWSVLAHLPRPVADLSMLRDLLAPEGALVILTVNAGSLLVAGQGDAWTGFTKNHLMFYSRQTLPRLLAKCGFAGAGFTPYYGDEIEAGASRLSPKELELVKRRVAATDGGNMMRAVGFATEAAMRRWGRQLPELVPIASEREHALPTA